MAATRTRRKATKKTPVRRKKPAAVKAKVKSVRPSARRRLAGGKKSAPTLRPGPPRPPEAEGAGTEEERIESSKYLPRRAPKRLFETERFVFPESYGVNRLRLLVKDPEWLFAHWDVDPKVLQSLRSDLGERALALSRLTLRLSDTVEGGSTVILLPKTARSFYIRADGAARSYQAELGLTLPSGEFRALAESNTVGTPRVGPSPEQARTRVRFDRTGRHVVEASAAHAASRPKAGRMADTRVVGKGGPLEGQRSLAQGGASDTYRK